MEFAAGLTAAAAGGAELAGAAAGASLDTIAISGGSALATGSALPSFASLAGGASLVGSILSGAATVGAVINATRAGNQQAAALEGNALDAETSVRAEGVQGEQRKSTIRRALMQQIGQRDVATAASGVDLSFGTPTIARAEDQRSANMALDIEDSTTSYNQSRLREAAANYRISAAQARQGGLAKAAGLAVTGGVDLIRRGVPKIDFG